MHILALLENEVTDLVREGFLISTEASNIRFNNSALVLNFIAYTRGFVRPQIKWSKGVRSGDFGGQATGP